MKDCSSQHSIFLLAFVILLTETAPAYLSQSRILLSTAHAQPQKLSVSMDLPSGNSRDINNSITQVEMSRDVEGRQKFKAVEWMKTLPTAAAATPSLSMRRLRMQAVRRLFPFNRRRRCARHQSTCALRWNRINWAELSAAAAQVSWTSSFGWEPLRLFNIYWKLLQRLTGIGAFCSSLNETKFPVETFLSDVSKAGDNFKATFKPILRRCYLENWNLIVFCCIKNLLYNKPTIVRRG